MTEAESDKGAVPPEGTEKDLLEAIQRLIEKRPTNEELARRAKRRVVHINPSTVAQEAGHSRSLISHDKCEYPDVRRKVLALRSTSSKAGSLAEANRKLRQENAELRVTVQTAREAMAAMARRMEQIVKDARRDDFSAERRAARGNRAPGEVAGLTKPESSSVKVSPIRGNGRSEQT